MNQIKLDPSLHHELTTAADRGGLPPTLVADIVGLCACAILRTKPGAVAPAKKKPAEPPKETAPERVASGAVATLITSAIGAELAGLARAHNLDPNAVWVEVYHRLGTHLRFRLPKHDEFLGLRG
jgi:hypothetical protein